MRFVRAVVVGAVAIGVATLGFGAPAMAAPSFVVDHAIIKFVPMIGSNSDIVQKYTVTGDVSDQDFHLHIETNAPNGVRLGGPAQPPMTCMQNGAIDCDIAGLIGSVSFDVDYSAMAMENGLGQAKSATFTATATLTAKSGAAQPITINSRIDVRPSADLDVSGDMNVRSLGNGGGAVLEFNVRNRGPSGSTTTDVLVTGFRSTPSGLPAGCAAAGTTVACTYHAGVTVDDSRSLSIPITADEAGCNYTVRVSGAYPDPKPGNNVHAFRNPSLPCGAPTPSGTPTTATPTPSSTPTSTPPSVPATSPSDTDSLASIPGGDASPGAGTDNTGFLLIAVGAGALLVTLGLALAYRAMRRT